ncbi:MAG: hypothetical protein KGM44_05090, partial [bacterium]|nr:hypothetical protein [bacterium]
TRACGGRMGSVNRPPARLGLRILPALLGLAVGGAMLAHAIFYALLGGRHEMGGSAHLALAALALCGLAWTIYDRRESGLCAAGWRIVPGLVALQFATFVAIEAGEGHLWHLNGLRVLLALLVHLLVAALTANSLPAIAGMLGALGSFVTAARGEGRISLPAAPALSGSLWHASQRASRAPPARR